MSNVGPDASSSYLEIGLIAGLYMLLAAPREAEADAQKGKILGPEQKAETLIRLESCLAVFLFLMSVIFCKGFYVRYTEYFPADILQERIRVKGGPLDGIYLLPRDAETEYQGRELIREQTEKEDMCVLLGTDQILNLSMNGRAVPPSTISTPAFDSQWIRYYTLYPQFLPDKVFIAKNTVDDRDKFFAQNEFGVWLAERYDIRNMTENDALCLIRRK